MQASPVDEASLTEFDPQEAPPIPAVDLPQQVREVISRLNQAERPLLLVGNGVRLARAEHELNELVRLLNVPVESTWLALDWISEDDPLFAGRPGTVAPRGPNFALQNCDFLLVIGARMDIPVIGYSPEHLARAAHKVMVDIDAAEIAKFGSTIQTPICADAGAFLRELLAQRDVVQAKDRSCWIKRCTDWKQCYPVVLPQHRQPGPVSVYHLAEIISDEVPADHYIVSGSSGSGIEVFCWPTNCKPGAEYFIRRRSGPWDSGLPPVLESRSPADGGRLSAWMGTEAFS